MVECMIQKLQVLVIYSNYDCVVPWLEPLIVKYGWNIFNVKVLVILHILRQ